MNINGSTRGRDDFSPKVKLTLAKRVNFRCSICDAHTVGPKTGTREKDFSIGKAAHIRAAAPGGPRYDPTQTPAQRAAIENGLWVCATCADIIDRDHDAYSVEDLHQIKEDAERLARERVGRNPDHAAQTLRTPTAIQRAVSAFCRREAAQQELLDPRFKVAVRMEGNGFVYELNAREPVEGRLWIGTRGRALNSDALRDFFSYGGAQAIEELEVRMEGSPLFPSGNVQRLQLSTRPRPIVITTILDDDGVAPMFIEFAGEATQGNKGFRFKGMAFGGMLTVTITADYAHRHCDFSLAFDIMGWARKSVRQLPHFARVVQVLKVLASPVQVRILCAHDGIELELGSGLMDGCDQFLSLRALVDEIEVHRKLDDFFGLDLTLPADLDDVLRDRGDLRQLLGMIELEKSAEREVQMTLVPSDSLEELRTIITNQTATAIRVNQSVTLDVWGQKYGPFDIDVTCPAALIRTVGPAVIDGSVPVQLVFNATDGHRWMAQVTNPRNG